MGFSYLSCISQGHFKVTLQAINICNFHIPQHTIIMQSIIGPNYVEPVEHVRGAPKWPFGPSVVYGYGEG